MPVFLEVHDGGMVATIHHRHDAKSAERPRTVIHSLRYPVGASSREDAHRVDAPMESSAEPTLTPWIAGRII